MPIYTITTLILFTLCCAAAGCHSSSSSNDDTALSAGAPAAAVDWTPVKQAIDDNQANFPDGVCVEIATPAGVVYSYSINGYSSTAQIPVASASKWVSATVLLQLVDQGILNLDEKMSAVLTDRNKVPWSGNMGAITLRTLLSQTSGIHGDDLNNGRLSSESSSPTPWGSHPIPCIQNTIPTIPARPANCISPGWNICVSCSSN